MTMTRTKTETGLVIWSHCGETSQAEWMAPFAGETPATEPSRYMSFTRTSDAPAFAYTFEEPTQQHGGGQGQADA